MVCAYLVNDDVVVVGDSAKQPVVKLFKTVSIFDHQVLHGGSKLLSPRGRFSCQEIGINMLEAQQEEVI